MADLKTRTARTLKWNTIDRVSTQVIYAMVGWALANVLTGTEYGLVGALSIFQAFAIIFVDSGFGAALLREKTPTQQDYSTVFWFNLLVAVAIYIVLFFTSPWIASLFGNSEELIPMSKVMFLTFVINGISIVQVNRLMKEMNVKQIAVANTISLIISGIVGVWMAYSGWGAWAMVWQAVVMAVVKTGWLWATSGWWPSICFSMESLRKIRRVGMSVFGSSLLNTISQNLYNFVIGIRYGLAPLGVYNIADKWSKMGTASISQVLTASFVPLLSKVQDSAADFRRYAAKSGRLTSFILLPAMTILSVCATDIFHLLFADKWDTAIPLFILLCIRGIFIVLIGLYSNFLLAQGKARHLMASEIVKDTMLFVAIFATWQIGSVEALIWGLLIATFATWGILIWVTSHGSDLTGRDLLGHLTPFILPAMAMVVAGLEMGLLYDWIVPQMGVRIAALCRGGAMGLAGVAAYLGAAKAMRLPELPEALGYILGRFKR